MFNKILSYLKTESVKIHNGPQQLRKSKYGSLKGEPILFASIPWVFKMIRNNWFNSPEKKFSDVINEKNKKIEVDIINTIETLSFAIAETSEKYRELIRRQLQLANEAGMTLTTYEEKELEKVKDTVYQLKEQLEKYKKMIEVAGDIVHHLAILSMLNGNRLSKESVSTRYCLLESSALNELKLNTILENYLESDKKLD